MSGGTLLAVAGVWVLFQVLGGDALGRLGVSGQPTTPGSGGSGWLGKKLPSTGGK